MVVATMCGPLLADPYGDSTGSLKALHMSQFVSLREFPHTALLGLDDWEFGLESKVSIFDLMIIKK